MKPVHPLVTTLPTIVSAEKAFRARALADGDHSAALPGGPLFFGPHVNIYHA
jgi:hypothetical protein